jgi:hypothetical protein
MILAPLAAAVAMSGTAVVDRTVSCQVPQQAGIPILTLQATPASRNKLIFAGLFAEANERNGSGGVVLLGAANVANGFAAPDANWCTPAPRIPLGPAGIPREGVYPKYSPGLGGGSGARCMTAGHVTIRIRTTILAGAPVAARLAVRSGRKQRPIAFVAWTPKKVTTYLTDDCQS